MANRPRTDAVREADRLTSWLLQDIGREVRVARIASGLRQVDVARRLGTSPASVCRVEKGSIRALTVRRLERHAAAVGLRPFVKLYPAARRILDQPQLDLLADFRARLHESWAFSTEVVMPIPGDLRAADCRFSKLDCVCIGEAYTRISDFQAQSRAAQLKKRDLGADRLYLIVRGTTSNRRALADAGKLVQASFPLGTRHVIRALARGLDPGDDGIVLL
ncbi:MAG: helix-turn-helix transcriptional regulator [Chloroflexota bacterium]